MGLFSKLFKSGEAADKSVTPSRDESQDEEEMVLGADTSYKELGAVEKKGAEKRRHPRIVQTTSGGAYGVPRVWVFGGRECYEDPKDESKTLSFDDAKENAAMPRPDLEGQVDLPRFVKNRTEKKE